MMVGFHTMTQLSWRIPSPLRRFDIVTRNHEHMSWSVAEDASHGSSTSLCSRRGQLR